MFCKQIINRENKQGEVEFLISGCSKGSDRFLLRVEKSRLMHN
jgi:hypothetical protein